MSLHEVTDSENVGIGFFAAFLEAIVLQPTLYWKNAAASGGKVPFSLKPSVIYRGTSTAIVSEMQMMGLQFGLTSVLQKLYLSTVLGVAAGTAGTTGQEEMSFFGEVILASAGGALSALTSSPMELIMIQQQLRGGSMLTQARRIVTVYGVGAEGLFRGLSQTMLRDSVYTAGLLGITPAGQNILERRGHSERAAGFYASVIGGVTCAIGSQPFDVMKTCLQGDLEREVHQTVGNTFRGLYESGGVSRFMKGSFFRTLNIVGTIYIANEVRVHATRALLNQRSSLLK